MRIDDFRALSLEDLDARIHEMKRQLFNYRMQLHSNQLSDTNIISKTRRDVARALTAKREKLSQAGK
ncbi:MAG: 50S ribosomal protein L29 [bacterium]|jgi:large subunit ribosomal protein L29